MVPVPVSNLRPIRVALQLSAHMLQKELRLDFSAYRPILSSGCDRKQCSMQVRVVEFNASTPFREQLEVMASTAVFVSVHTSNLANAQFLQPGSAVVELIQRNWIWHNLDRSFQVPFSPSQISFPALLGMPCEAGCS